MNTKKLLASLLVLGWSLTLAISQAQADAPQFRIVWVGELAEHARHVAVQDGLAYVVGKADSSQDQLLIADISDPAAPNLLGVFRTAKELRSVAVSGELAMLANGYHGLLALDISDPTHPVEVGRSQAMSYAADVAIQEPLVFVADGDGSLRIFDASDPSRLKAIGVSAIEDYEAYAVAVSGSLAFLASGGRGLRVIDVSEPTSPRSVGFYDLPGPYRVLDVALGDGIAYVADENILDLNGNLRILDISRPQAPLEIGAHTVPNPALSVTYQDGYAFLAHAAGGLSIFDVTDSRNPQWKASYRTSGRAADVTLGDGVVVLADETGGLQLLHFLRPFLFLPAIHENALLIGPQSPSLIQ